MPHAAPVAQAPAVLLVEDDAALSGYLAAALRGKGYHVHCATDRASAVHRALAQLKPKERQLVSLAFFRGLTHQEIAVACAMPIGSVKTTMHKAFRQMQATLGGEGWGLDDE